MAAISNSSGIDWNDVDGLTIDFGASLRFLAVRSFNLSTDIRYGVGTLTNVGGVRTVTFNDLSSVVFTGNNPNPFVSVTINTMNFTNVPNPGDNMTAVGSFTLGMDGLHDGILTSGTNIVGGQKFTVVGNLSISDGDDPDPLHATAGTISKMTLTAGIYTVTLTGAMTVVGGSTGIDPAFNGTVSGITIQQTGSATILFSATGLAANNAGDLLNGLAYGSLGDFIAALSAGHDSITGGAGADLLEGGGGNDTISGLGGADTLDGGAGSNSLDGGLGDDSYIDGGGDDTFAIAQVGDSINFGAGEGSGDRALISVAGSPYLDLSDDTGLEQVVFTGAVGVTITGNAQFNQLTGGTGNDTIVGGDGVDGLFGGTGNDSLDASVGDFSSDNMFGGAGNDTYRVDDDLDLITDTGGNDTVIVVGASLTLGAGSTIENLTISGGVGTSGTGNALANILGSENGTHTLTGLAGNDTYNIQSDDVVTEDSVAGAGAADLVNVFLLNGQSYGLAGNVENLSLFEEEGTVTGLGNPLANLITGSTTSNNSLMGGGGNDTLIGKGGDDTLEGAAGADNLQGGLGNDRYYVDLTATAAALLSDTITDIGGTDSLFVFDSGGATTFTYTMLAALDHIDISDFDPLTVSITGNALANSMAGHNGSDTLKGEAGNDTLYGFNGTNSLDGGLGDDQYENDLGIDTFRISQAGDTIVDGINANEGAATVVVTLAGNQYLDISDDPNLTNVTFEGTAGVTINGNVGANSLKGGSGNDSLNGGAGIDSMAGGGGNDTYQVDSALELITDTAGIDTVVAVAIDYTLGVTSGLEGLILSGGEGFAGLGNLLNNTLTSEEGDHTLIGGLGNDTFNVQTGDNVQDGEGGGADLVIATMGHGQTFTIGEGIDRLTLIASEGNITLTGNGNEIANLITGTNDANDSLFGDDANDSLLGNGGNDTLNGGAGADALNGGAGNDTYHSRLLKPAATVMLDDIITDSAGIDTLVLAADAGVTNSNYTFVLAAALENLDLSGVDANTPVNGSGNASDNIITGNATINTLSGLGGNDTLNGLGGNNSLSGGDGNDLLLAAGDGGDQLAGGLGNDTFNIDAGFDVITSDTGGIDLVQVFSGGDFSLEALVTLENLSFFDGAAGNTGTGNELANLITTDAGEGVNGDDTLLGMGGNDTLSSNDMGDSLDGGAGNDSLFGGAGADSMVGGAGNDTFHVDNVGDTVSEEGDGGTDLVFSITNYSLEGDIDLENLILRTSGTVGTGNLSANVLTSDEGSTTLNGGDGNDTFNVYASDVVSELTENGTDSVFASLLNGQSFTLGNFVENLTLLYNGEGTITGTGTGNGLANIITGSDNANDSLYGLAGLDILNGGGGNDYLDGGPTRDGIDSLAGGLGNDTFHFALGDLAGEGFVEQLDWQDASSDTGGIDTYKFTSGGAIPFGSFTGNLQGSTIENLDFSGMAAGVNVTGMGQIDGIGANTNNSIVGHDGNDTLSGGGGNDTLDGLAGGNDMLSGDEGNDQVVLHNVAGDSVSGGAGIDTLVYAGEGTIDLTNHPTFEHLTLRIAEVVTGIGNNSANVLTSELGNHSLDGAGGNDTYNVQAGDSVADSGGVADTMDTVIATLGHLETLTIGGGIERLTLLASGPGITLTGIGNDLANLITGTGENDELYGNELNDTLIGGAGNDLLAGGAGADNLQGGLGHDSYLFQLTAGMLSDTITDTGGIDSVVVQGGAGVTSFTYTMLAAIEHLDAAAVESPVNLSITGNLLGNSMIGHGGADTLKGEAGNDTINGINGDDSLTGGAGNDRLLGDNGNSTLDGGTENDSLDGGALFDSLVGGAGNDTLSGGTENDTLDGGLGTDVYKTGDHDDTYVVDATDTFEVVGGVDNGIDTLRLTSNLSAYRNIDARDYFENLVFVGTGNIALTGNEGVNQLTGAAGADTLDGGEGGDLLTGGAGNDSLDGTDLAVFADSLVGGLGNDTYRVDISTDLITEAALAGTDTVLSNANFYQLLANIENLTILGGGEGTGVGNSGANIILGDSSNNWISGKGGNDTLTGGAGTDTFIFETPETAPLAGSYARITDFSHDDDVMALEETLFDDLINGGVFGGGGLILTLGSAAVGVDAQLVYNPLSGALYYDLNGATAGGSTQIALLTSKPTLDTTDFTVFTGYV